MDRLLAGRNRLAEAAIVAWPADQKAEEMGLKRLLDRGTILQIPQAGLAATDEKIKSKRGEAIEGSKGGDRGPRIHVFPTRGNDRVDRQLDGA